ncbi:MAG: MFS transporter [Clostridiales bacterium]|nr:MFS transporter [Clostridiales bacterium]
MHRKKTRISGAVQIIIIFGLISMFGDIIYEGARGANGQYLQLLGANATSIGIIVGLGEFLAYCLRLAAGFMADKTRKYWPLIFIGYGMLIVVPMMGISGQWKYVLAFIMLERVGKALRSPAKDTILSHVAEGEVGTGFAFGLQEALDQIGALAGPLLFVLVFWLTGRQGISEYRTSYMLTFVPYIALMFILYLAYKRVSREKLMEVEKKAPGESDKLVKIFWVYSIFTFVAVLGFANFPLIGYHLKAANIMPDSRIPLLYSLAMAVDAIVALIIGKLYDTAKKRTGNKKSGLLTLLFIPLFTALIPFLAFGKSAALAVGGMICYGAVMGAHETVMRSAIADITTLRKRGLGYGIFNTSYGVALFFGSSLFGFLYDNFGASSIQFTVVAVEIAAIALFLVMRKQIQKEG